MPGLYVHIPFCRRKCRYCDFVSFPGVSEAENYLDALARELAVLSPMMSGRRFDTVFIGGGTPSVLPEGAVEGLVGGLRRSFDIAPDAEITIEVNPESASLEKLKEYFGCGINRLSIGLQSADDAVLERIGRIHDFNRFLGAYGAARAAGFSNINADVIHGLPGQSLASYLDTLRLLGRLGAEHISSYALILEEGTPLYGDVRSGRAELPDDDETADMEDAGFELLASMGYRRYEISSFARPGFESRHNLNYWNNGEYLGVGLNSHSAMRLNGKWMRWANGSVLSEYIEKCGENRLPTAQSEEVSREDEMFETVMVGLRMTDGIDRRVFYERFGIDPVENYASAVSEAVLDGSMTVTDERMALTKRGLDFQNEVLLKFM